MITYVDTSVLVKLVIDEDGSDDAATVWATAANLASVPLVKVEARAALAAARRARRITLTEHRTAKAEITALVDQLTLASLTDELIDLAGALAEEHALRGYNAVHLAGAITAGAQVMASADEALCEAASGLGFHIANPLDA